MNGDLLLGHILGAHVGDLAFNALIGYSADERRLGFTPSQNPAAPPVQEVLAAIDAAIGGVRVLMGRVAEQARPSADAKPSKPPADASAS